MFTFEQKEERGVFEIHNEKGVYFGSLSLVKIGEIVTAKDGSYFDVYHRVKIEWTDDVEDIGAAMPTSDDLYEFFQELFYMDSGRAGAMFCHGIDLFADETMDSRFVVAVHYGYDV